MITATIIFCVRWLWPCSSWQCSQSQWQSRKTRYHDTHNINPENTNSHGSTQCGTISACANSGANRLIIDKTIGNTQQNKCGKMLAIIPNFIALFFIYKKPMLVSPTGMLRHLGSLAHTRCTGVLASASRRRFEPLPHVRFLLVSPTGIEPVSRV